MLVSATEMLKKAKAGHYAVGQFNINNLEWTKSILLTAQASSPPIEPTSASIERPRAWATLTSSVVLATFSSIVTLVNFLLRALKQLNQQLRKKWNSSVQSAKQTTNQNLNHIFRNTCTTVKNKRHNACFLLNSIKSFKRKTCPVFRIFTVDITNTAKQTTNQNLKYKKLSHSKRNGIIFYIFLKIVLNNIY